MVQCCMTRAEAPLLDTVERTPLEAAAPYIDWSTPLLGWLVVTVCPLRIGSGINHLGITTPDEAQLHHLQHLFIGST